MAQHRQKFWQSSPEHLRTFRGRWLVWIERVVSADLSAGELTLRFRGYFWPIPLGTIQAVRLGRIPRTHDVLRRAYVEVGLVHDGEVLHVWLTPQTFVWRVGPLARQWHDRLTQAVDAARGSANPYTTDDPTARGN